MYVKGEGVKQDYLKSIELFKKACSSGDALGCIGVGFIHLNGNKEYTDRHNDINGEGCEAGFALACRVEFRYLEGIKQDILKAAEFFGKACDLKDQMVVICID